MPKTETLNVDPRVTHAGIALALRNLANLFDQLADPTVTREITDNGITAEEIAKAKPAKAKPAKAKEEKVVEETKPELTPAEVAADLKAKLVALVGKDRAKAVSLLGTVGAKNFSSIPVEKHGHMLRLVDEALNGKAGATIDDDPLA